MASPDKQNGNNAARLICGDEINARNNALNFLEQLQRDKIFTEKALGHLILARGLIPKTSIAAAQACFTIQRDAELQLTCITVALRPITDNA